MIKKQQRSGLTAQYREDQGIFHCYLHCCVSKSSRNHLPIDALVLAPHRTCIPSFNETKEKKQSLTTRTLQQTKNNYEMYRKSQARESS